MKSGLNRILKTQNQNKARFKRFLLKPTFMHRFFLSDLFHPKPNFET